MKHQPSATDTANEKEVSNDVISKHRSRLHRSFSQLYTAKGEHEAALKEITENIYLESVVLGPEHHSLSGSYLIMGDIFAKWENDAEKIETAIGFYIMVANIWRKFLEEN